MQAALTCALVERVLLSKNGHSASQGEIMMFLVLQGFESKTDIHSNFRGKSRKSIYKYGHSTDPYNIKTFE